MAGEGNPGDPAQARLQVSRHVKVVGLLLVQRGHVPTQMRLSDNTSSHHTLECGRNAGVPDGLRATETAFVYLCQSKLATVDTTLATTACQLIVFYLTLLRRYSSLWLISC
jgi:hypothetical protein